MHLSRSTACFAVRLLLSVAVVYRFFPAENKSIFAQRYGPCTPPDGTKHTNVRRVGTKYKTIVKEVHCALIPCGFSALAPLAEMRYTGNAKTNVKGNFLGQTLWVCQLPRGGFGEPPQSAPVGRSQLPQGDALWQCRKLCRHRRSRPLGEGGLTRSGKTEGVPA